MSWNLRKRFWETVVTVEADGGWAVELDGMPLKTPAKRKLLVPGVVLAEALAKEWLAVEGEIDPARMPLTRTVNSALDRVAPEPQHVVDELSCFGESDLICYRAGAPEELRTRQAEAWDRWVQWSGSELNAPLQVATGVMHLQQAPESLATLKGWVSSADAFELTALHDLVVLSGSLVLGLAVARGAVSAETAWELSRIDERWQEEQWGRDSEASESTERKRSDFLQAREFLGLLSLSVRP